MAGTFLPLICGVEIDAGGGDISVAEPIPNRLQVVPLTEQLGCYEISAAVSTIVAIVGWVVS